MPVEKAAVYFSVGAVAVAELLRGTKGAGNSFVPEASCFTRESTPKKVQRTLIPFHLGVGGELQIIRGWFLLL